MQTAVVHGQATLAQLGIDFDEAFAEAYVAPGVILLCLHGGRNDWIDSDHRDNKEDPAGFERLGSCAKQRTRFIDRMSQS